MVTGEVSLVQAIVLGVVQGLTEFLPISSTAHLRVVPALLGWPDPGVAFSAVIQLGSVFAVVGYFWQDLISIAKGSLQAIGQKDYANHNLRLAVGIVIGTIPVVILGLLFKHVLQDPNGPARSLIVIAVASMVMGLLLAVAEKLGKRTRSLENLGAQDGLLVGFGQALALIPGCSRSGSTITTALFLNIERADAARFSFLLGIPAIVAAGLLELKELLEVGLKGEAMTSLIVGLVVSAIVSWLSIAWLTKYLQQHSTWVFVGYRLIFGAAILYLATNHLIS